MQNSLKMAFFPLIFVNLSYHTCNLFCFVKKIYMVLWCVLLALCSSCCHLAPVLITSRKSQIPGSYSSFQVWRKQFQNLPKCRKPTMFLKTLCVFDLALLPFCQHSLSVGLIAQVWSVDGPGSSRVLKWLVVAWSNVKNFWHVTMRLVTSCVGAHW